VSAKREQAAVRILGALGTVAALGLMVPIAQAESLAEAWSLALGNDAAYAAVKSQHDSASADFAAARGARWPSLTVSASETQLNDAPYLDINTPAGALVSPKLWNHDRIGMADAAISLPLYTSGQISAGISAAQHHAEAAAAIETSAAQDLRFAVVDAYIGVLRARRALAVAEAKVSSLTAHRDDVQVMYDKEAVALNDLLAARVATANAEQDRLRAANTLSVAAAAYNRLLGQPLDRLPELEVIVPPAGIAGSATLEELLSQAVHARPELQAGATETLALGDQAAAERARGGPQLALTAGYNHFDNTFLNRQDFASVGVGVRWTIFDGGQSAQRAAALRSAARASSQQMADRQSRIELEVREAWLGRETAASRLAASGEAVAQSEENVRIARELYRSGMGTNTQVLDAETLRATSTSNRDNAQLDLVLAGYRLQHAVGNL
jgi:outer membrane protein TolC